jgi:hypothetical protein
MEDHLTKGRKSRWDGISNGELLTATIVTAGYSTFMAPVFCFGWPSGSGGEEVAAIIAKLPSQYVVPGSSAVDTVDMDELRNGFPEADELLHGLIAYGRISAEAQWIQEIRTMTSRAIILLGYVRDVIPHRMMSFFADASVRQEKKWVDSDRVKKWMDSEDYNSEHQLELLYHIKGEARGQPMHELWMTRNDTAFISGKDADWDAELPSVYLGPIGVATDPRRTLCIFAGATSLPIPWTLYQESTVPRQTVGFDELARLDEKLVSKFVEAEEKELFFVARAKDELESLSHKHGCRVRPPQCARCTQAWVPTSRHYDERTGGRYSAAAGRGLATATAGGAH